MQHGVSRKGYDMAGNATEQAALLSALDKIDAEFVESIKSSAFYAGVREMTDGEPVSEEPQEWAGRAIRLWIDKSIDAIASAWLSAGLTLEEYCVQMERAAWALHGKATTLFLATCGLLDHPGSPPDLEKATEGFRYVLSVRARGWCRRYNERLLLSSTDSGRTGGQFMLTESAAAFLKRSKAFVVETPRPADSQPAPAAGNGAAEIEPEPAAASGATEPQASSNLLAADDDVMQGNEALIFSEALEQTAGKRKRRSMHDQIQELRFAPPDPGDPDFEIDMAVYRIVEQEELAYSEYCEACANAGKPNSRRLFGEFVVKCFDIFASNQLYEADDRDGRVMFTSVLQETHKHYMKILEPIAPGPILLRLEGRFHYWAARAREQERRRAYETALPAPAESQPERATGNGRRYPKRADWLKALMEKRGLAKHAIYQEGGPHSATIDLILAGEKVSERVLNKLAKALKVAPRDIPDDHPEDL
jgi:hypothetical protein